MRNFFFLSALVCICFLPGPALAAEAEIKIQVNIVQCGKRADLFMACQRNDKCCGLYEQAVASGYLIAQSEEPEPPPEPEPEPEIEIAQNIRE